MAARRPAILVIDDDHEITTFLKRSLGYAGYNVETASSGELGLDRALNRPPDLIVLDVLMGGMSGLEVARLLRAESDVPILMLTARDEVSDRVSGLDSGADDYLVKPFAFEELLARVRALLRRREPASGKVLVFQDIELDMATREVRRGQRAITFTAKEFDLLTMLARNPRHVLTREQLLDGVWGFDSEVAPHILEVYIRYLREKLESEGEPRVIQTVRGVGYALRDS